jgi:serine/threonine protein kinase
LDFDGPLLKGRWRLGPRLGAGGQGRTYLARDEGGGGRTVVVKQLRLGGDGGWKKFDLFEREVRVLSTLRHPAIPQLLSHFEDEPPGTFYVVMERAPGATLRAIATRARFRERDLRDVLVRVLEILGYLHGRTPPVIHRDIKPANLLREVGGRITLVDFGGVRDALRPDGGSTVIGTFGYMAPEQLHGEASPATDLYGLGATLVALAGGVEPERVPRRGLRMDLRAHLPDLSPALRALLERMTAPDPAERPQSAAETIALLGRLDREHGTTAVPATARGGTSTTMPGALATRPDDDDGLIELDPSIPWFLRAALGAVFFAIGLGGWVALAIVQRLLLPIAFTVASAFVSPERRARLRGTRDTAVRALGEGQRGFRRLQKHAFPRRRELPAPRG